MHIIKDVVKKDNLNMREKNRGKIGQKIKKRKKKTKIGNYWHINGQNKYKQLELRVRY